MTLTVGQLVAYLSVEGVAAANRDVTAFQQGMQRAGDTAAQSGAKLNVAEQGVKGTGDAAVQTSGKLRDTSGALVGAATAAGQLTTSQNQLEASGRKVAESAARSEAAQAGLTAAQARLSAAEQSLTGIRAAGNATAAQASAAEARVANAKLGVVIASSRVAEASTAETAAMAANTAALEASAAASSDQAAASGEAADASQDVSAGASDASDSVKQLGQTASVAGAGILGAFAAAQVMFSNFDAQMSVTGAAAQVTGGDLDRLRQAALDAGASTFFSATQAAQGEEELAKAGVSVSSIVNGGLIGSLNLAAAGQISVADAAQTAASAMTVFGLSGAAVPHIADLLAAAAGKAQGGVDDMSQALNQSSLVAHQMGLSVEQTTGALALFASNGLLGSDAGTSFKTMLLALNPASDQAAQLVKQLGISAYDSQGKFIGLAQYAQLLHDKLAPLPTDQRNMALQTIFGTDAIRAASIVMDAGSKGVQTWTSNVNDSGYASQQAGAKMDNLKGDVEQLSGAIQTGILQNSGGLNDALRTMAEHATNDVTALGHLPPIVGQVGTALGAGTGGVLLMIGSMTLLSNSLGNVSTRLMDVATTPTTRFTGAWAAASKSVGVLSTSLTAIVPVVAVAAIGFDIWAQHQAANKAATDKLTASLDAQSGAITNNTRSIALAALQSSGAADAADKLNISQKDLVDASLGNAAAQKRVADAMDQAADSTSKNNNEQLRSAGGHTTAAGAAVDNSVAIDKVKDALSGQNKQLQDAQGKLQQAKQAQTDDATAAQQLADKQAAATTTLGGTTVAMRGQTDAATILKNALDTLSGKAVSAEQANLALQAGLDQLAVTTKNNSDQQLVGAYSLTQVDGATGLYTTSVVQNRQAIIGAIQQANAHAQAVFEQTRSVDAATGALNTDEGALRAAAVAAGLNAGEVDALVRQYAAVPGDVSTTVNADTSQAQGALASIQGTLRVIAGTSITVPVYIKQINGVDTDSGTMRQMLAGNATGGLITGPGTGTSDDIAVRVSNGEFIVTAAAVNRLGVPYLDAINRGADPVQYLGRGKADTSTAAAPAATTQPGRKVEITNYISGWEAEQVEAYNRMQLSVVQV